MIYNNTKMMIWGNVNQYGENVIEYLFSHRDDNLKETYLNYLIIGSDTVDICMNNDNETYTSIIDGNTFRSNMSYITEVGSINLSTESERILSDYIIYNGKQDKIVNSINKIALVSFNYGVFLLKNNILFDINRKYNIHISYLKGYIAYLDILH